MRLFLYYALHSIKNQIKKLMKTWVAVFLLVCVGIGVVFGLGAVVLTDAIEDNAVVEEMPVEDEAPLEEEITLSPEEFSAVLELIAAAVILAMLFFNVLNADKSGGQIFQMADVNLLFPAPMKPQSVLLFRLLSQLGALLLASAYFLFQLPNLILNLGMDWLTAVALLLAWFLLLVYGKLFNLLLYTVCSTHERLKSRIRPVAYGAAGVLLAAFLLFWKRNDLPVFDALKAFFNPAWTRAIPVYGWLKGLALFPAEGNLLAAGLCLLGLVIGAAVLIHFIWHIRADFYEDALQHSEETAELKQAMESAGQTIAVRRKKDRDDRLLRDGLSRGFGANVYFYKSLYNRFRFAHARVFTKTSETYLVIAVGICLLMSYGLQIHSLLPTALALALFCFFRSLGNPLATDIQQDSFRMVPESAYAKVFYSLMGGSLNCLLDLLPAFLAATVWMRVNPVTALVWMLFAVTVDFYSANVGLFLDLAIPTTAGKIIKQLIQVMFVYFGLAPVAILIVIGFVLEMVPLFLALAVAFNLGIGFLFFAISPPFIQNGQK